MSLPSLHTDQLPCASIRLPGLYQERQFQHLLLGHLTFFFLHMIHPIPHHPLPSNLHLLKVPLRSNLYETLPKSPVYTDIPFIQVPVTKHPIVSPRRIL